jgi:GATA-binding protein
MSKSQGGQIPEVDEDEGMDDGNLQQNPSKRKEKPLAPNVQQSTSQIVQSTTHHTPIAPAVTPTSGTQEWEWLTMSL